MNSRTFILMRKIFFFTFFLLSTIQTAFATIEVLSVSHATSGNCDGSIIVFAEGNAGPFVLLLEGSDGSVEFVPDVNGGYTFSDLCAAEYTITVTNAYGCATVLYDEVKSCLEITSITPICICVSGSAELEISGGSGSYNYAWSSWYGTYSNQENPAILPPAFGGPETHTVTITDLETGCQATANMELDVCTGFDLSSFITVTPDCNEEGTNTISVQLPPGMGLGPFEFRWSKAGFGLVEFDPSQDGFASLENAAPGEYCLNLRTMNGCDETVCGIMVESQPAPVINYTVKPSNNGDGVIIVDMIGQQGPFSFQWALGLTPMGQTTPTISNLEPGEYSVTVTNDIHGCKSTAKINVIGCDEIAQSINPIEAQVIPISLSGSLGAIDILNVSDQFPGYNFNYNWSNNKTVEDNNDLISGSYTLVVSSNDCNFSVSDTWVVCGFSVGFEVFPYLNNCDIGELHLNISPDDNYSILWNDPAQSTTEVISAEYGVEYCVTISIGFAPNDCQATACFTPEPPPIKIELINLEHATYGFSTGVIEVDANVGPYSGLYDLSYSWSNGSEGPMIQNLSPGEYTVTVTDDCGNSATATYSIQCELLESDIEADVTHASCSSSTGGSINLTALPFFGTPNPIYTFKWNNGATTEDISGLNAGEYCVTIVEASTGCVAFDCFEVSADGAGAFTISFDMQPGCYPLNEGQITAVASNTALGPFEYYWFNFNWSTYQTQYLGNTATLTDVPAGWYSVILTDAMGCTASNYTLMWPATPSFGVAMVEDPVIVCSGETGTSEVEVTYGNPPGPLTYEWTNYSIYPLQTISTDQQPVLQDMAPGSWGVKVINGDGCQAFTNFLVQEAYIRVESEIELACGKGSIELTPFISQWLPTNPPFTYLWSDNNTNQNRNDLGEGTYCVTITDAIGCTFSDCYEVGDPSGTALLLSSVIENNGCGAQCSGSILLEINPSIPVSIQWADGNFYKPKERFYLCPGEYTVTITSNVTGCTEVHPFPVGQAGQETFEYDVEVLYYFGNQVNFSGNAVINIQSDLFEFPGQIAVFSSPQMNQPAIVTHSVNNPNIFNTSISENFSNVDLFYFTYTAPNDCVYTGSFPGIPACVEEPGDGFNFTINYSGDPQGDCGPNQSHTYNLNVDYMGTNFPYFVEVTMEDAYAPSESGYKQTIEINSFTSSITIEGVPAGTVKFKTYNLCDDHLFSRTHVNCCGTFFCEVISQGSGPQYGGYHYYDFPYFRLRVEKSLNDCFDSCGNWFEGDCSRIVVDVNEGFAPGFNCWTGQVTITFPEGGSPLIFEVMDSDPFDIVKLISGDGGWAPSHAGTYEIGISYIGSDPGPEDDCQTELSVNWYGAGNYNDLIIFMDNHWYIQSQNVPQIFKDAYYGVSTCQGCVEDGSYFFGSGSDDDCEPSFGNYQFTYFDFVPDPNNYNAANPCNSGGTLTIIDFDENGIATVQDVTIPPNSAVASLPGQFPLNIPDTYGCSNFGWCLFDANLEPSPIYDVYVNEPLLAMYGECVQVIFEDPNENPNPCFFDSDCPEDYECDPITGNCYLPCDSDYDCPFGQECNEEGHCVPESNGEVGGCFPVCPSGWECHEGECYLQESICGFHRKITGQGGYNVYYLWHDLDPGTTINFDYRTYNIPDKFLVYEGNSNTSPLLEIGCVSTGTQADPGSWGPTEEFTVGPENAITIVVESCGSSSSKFEFKLTCNPLLNEPSTNNLVCNGTVDPNEVFIDPNPFSSEIKIQSEFRNYFKGEIRLYDNIGTQVFRQDYEHWAGNADFTINGLGHLPPSIYFLTITKDGELCKEKKLVKME